MFNCDKRESFRIWIPPFPPRRRPPAGWARAGGGERARAQRARVRVLAVRVRPAAAAECRDRQTAVTATAHDTLRGTAWRHCAQAPTRDRDTRRRAPLRAAGRARARPGRRPLGLAGRGDRGRRFATVGQKIAPDKTLSVNEQHARG